METPFFRKNADTTPALSDESALYLGVDGGASKTAFALGRADGTILRCVRLRGCSPTVCGMENCLAILREGVAALQIAPGSLSGVFFGVAGCPDEARQSALLMLCAELFPGVAAGANADIVNVIYSSGYRGDCVGAICGTGSVAFAYKDGKLFRAGGWGPLFDRAGSGLDIGRDAVRAALAAEDGLGPDTALSQALRDYFGKSVFDGAAGLAPNDFAAIASFAPLVFEKAAQNDAVADRILKENFERLAFLIDFAQKRYQTPETVILSGGVAKNRAVIDRYLRPLLPEKTEWFLPDREPVCGALCAAAQLA